MCTPVGLAATRETHLVVPSVASSCNSPQLGMIVARSPRLLLSRSVAANVSSVDCPLTCSACPSVRTVGLLFQIHSRFRMHRRLPGTRPEVSSSGLSSKAKDRQIVVFVGLGGISHLSLYLTWTSPCRAGCGPSETIVKCEVTFEPRCKRDGHLRMHRRCSV
jgi:hypothetical protein